MRKRKFSKEQIVHIVNQYNNGIGIKKLTNKYSIVHSMIYTWVSQFNRFGESYFDNQLTNPKYSKEFKWKVVEYYLENGSAEKTAIHFNIRAISTVTRWAILYNRNQELKDYNPKPEVYMAKTRKVSYEEKIIIVKEIIENNYDYKGMAEKYETSYAQVFNWVKKYKQSGEEGLKDRRGINKAFDDLTDIEKLKRENEQLKREKYLLELEVVVAKKLQELERRGPSVGLNTSKYIKKSKK